MIQKAVVKKILDENHAQIEVQRQSACGHDCEKCGGCGAPTERVQATAINSVAAKVGDIVEFPVPSGATVSYEILEITL